MVERSFGNIGNVEVDEVRNINPIDLLKYKFVVFSNPEQAVDFISSKLSVKAA